jgi:CubicO group peptidase (beta-lactamase class C family)
MQALEALAGWPVGHAAAAVVVGEPDTGPPVTVATAGDADRPGPWASVTKLCTALAVLVAVEEGTLDLDQPAGPPGSTVAHLLAHASGLGPQPGQVLAPPGTRRIYSNAGFDLLGHMVAAAAELPFEVYLAEAVLEPAGLVGATLAPGGSAASGMTGTLHDLVQLARELQAPAVIHRSTLDRATAVAFPGLAGVVPGFGRQDPCDWGLGFERRGTKQPHWTGSANSPSTFGHFGRAGSFLWVDPDASAALAVQTDREFGPWAAAAWPALSDAVVTEIDGLRRDRP